MMWSMETSSRNGGVCILLHLNFHAILSLLILIVTSSVAFAHPVGTVPIKKPHIFSSLERQVAAKNPQVYSEKERSEDGDDDEGDGSPPYFVRAGRSSFYGGLVTYGHELHPARICRVLNGCVRNDGTVVLPAWMRRYDETLSFHCGVDKLEFSLDDTEAPPKLRKLDLFGSIPAPVALHKFITEFSPQLVALDLLLGERTLATSCHSRVGRKCKYLPLLAKKIRPAVFIHPDIKKQSKRTSWILQFMEIIPAYNYVHKVARLPQETQSESDADSIQCFRSVVLTRSPRTKFSINRETIRALNIFPKNNITKTPKTPLERMTADGALCNVNIMFVNRRKLPQNSGKLGLEGYITNIGNLRTDIRKRAKRFKGLSVKVNAVTLDTKRLKYKIDAMQKADILIAGSSPALANMIFMRSNSTVMEVMPFGYYPKTYENLALYNADVRYDSYIAHPDHRTFVNCLSAVAPWGSANFTLAENVIKRYRKAASQYRRSDSTHSYTLHSLKHELDFVRPCAKIQRLSSSSDRFAAAIIRNARLQCGIGLDTEPTIV